MTKIEDLEAELKELKEKSKREERIKSLQKQIKAEKFAQTKGGKIFNKIGDAGMKVAKKITTPVKHKPTTKSKVKTKKPLTAEQIEKKISRMAGF